MKEVLELTGTVEKIIFRNDSNGYTVAAFRVESAAADGLSPEEAADLLTTDEETLTIVGTFGDCREGRSYLLRGSLTSHARYGTQFQADYYEEEMPKGREAVEQFLASGTIKGVGPKMAAAIVERFGDDTLTVIETEPDRLTEISGIGEKKAAAIADSYKAQREFASIAIELQRYGITSHQAMTLYKTFGAETVATVTDDPYLLVGEDLGIGFRRADAIAQRMGIGKEDPSRVKAGLRTAVGYYTGEGHTFAPRDELTEQTAAWLEVPIAAVDEQLVQLAFEGDVKVEILDGRQVVYPIALYAAEKYVAWKLGVLVDAGVKTLKGEAESVVDMAQRDLAMTFSFEQRQAILSCLENSVCVITGGPGTGKTTIITGILRIFRDNGLIVKVAAPTGRAAKRITQTTGAEASTIHRLLEYYYDEGSDTMCFGKDGDDPLEADAVIIDEASMVDILLMQGLLKALRPGTRLVIVGDADQLPSVGAGNVLSDILDSEYVHAVRLKDIYRQAEESLIVVNAHRINQGEYPSVNEKDGDFFFLTEEHEKEMLDTIVSLCRDRLPAAYDMTEGSQTIQVITPTRKGTLGTINLNKELQQALNPAAPGKREKNAFGKVFREGDKVMQIRNNYQLAWKTADFEEGQGVFNGDVGTVARIDEDEGVLTVVYDEDRYAAYEFGLLDELELAYAVTVHKAQGSEFPIVVMPMTWFPPVLATRNLIYTGITRAKDLVVLVGSPGRMNAMVDNDHIARRNSGLAARLKGML